MGALGEDPIAADATVALGITRDQEYLDVGVALPQTRRELEAAGRDPGEVTVSMLGPSIALTPPQHALPATLHGSRQQIVDGLAAYAAAGLEHAALTLAGSRRGGPSGYLDAMQEIAEEILPALR